MTVTNEQVQRFTEIFQGLDRAYGKFTPSRGTSDSGKRGGDARTLTGPVGENLYHLHLTAQQGLGIIPITDDATCRWGVIDVDSYNLHLEELSHRLEQYPVVLCRSKSGGAHIFTFFREWVPASLCRDKLMQLAAVLGFGGCEIFPKQTQLRTEAGDTGNWLNLPYFGGDQTTRYAIKAGDGLDLDEFFEYVDAKALTLAQLEDLAFELPVPEEDWFEDGPPCLKILSGFGFPEGFRNEALFSVGIYLKKRFPNELDGKLQEYNVRFMKPPLDAGEVMSTIKSLQKKDYNYKCTQEPIRSHCDRRTCLGCRFGVNSEEMSEDNLPNFTGLNKIDFDPPTWFVSVDGHRVGPLQTRDWVNPNSFKIKLLEQTNTVLPTITLPRWNRLISKLMENVDIVEVPKEMSQGGMLWTHVVDMIRRERPAITKADFIQSTHHFRDEEHIYVKPMSLTAYLKKQRVGLEENIIFSHIKEQGGEMVTVEEGNIAVKAWRLPNFMAEEEDLSIPNVQEPEF